MSAEEHKRTRSLLFVKGLAGEGTEIFSSPWFRLVRFAEADLARWQRLSSRVIRETREHESGGPSVRRAHAFARDVPPPWWDVREDSSDPAQLSECWAVDSTSPGDHKPSGIFGANMVSYTRPARAVLLLLRLARAGYLRPVREMLICDEDDATRLGTTTHESPTSTGIADWQLWRVDGDTERTLKRTAACLWKPLVTTLDELPDDCTVAIDHFVDAQLGDWDDWELNLWISLEAMFGVNASEVIFRLSQNCAIFVAPPKECFATARLLNDRYSERSSIAHGSRKPSKKRLDQPFAEIFREKVLLEEVVRAALRRYLRLRLVAGVKRDEIHRVLRVAVFDRTELDVLPTDPAKDAALDGGA